MRQNHLRPILRHQFLLCTARATPLQNALAVMIGLWPLTAIVLLCTGLLIMAGNHGMP